MPNYTSNDRLRLKVGVSSYSENLNSLEVIGRVDATTYFGSGVGLTGIISATNATNIYGGGTGQLLYQAQPGLTSAFDNGSTGLVLKSRGPGQPPEWAPNTPQGSIDGLLIFDEGSNVGPGTSFNGLDFRGLQIEATGTSAGGISTIIVSQQPYVDLSGISTSVIGGIGSLTQLTVSGVSTFSVINAESIGITTINLPNIIGGTATFSGDVSIGGTLTYEDVTNIDSIGFITARTGLNVGYGPGIGITLLPSGNGSFAGIITAQNINVIEEVTASNFNSTSDKKLKNNIELISNPIEKVLKINGVSFNWIENNKPSVGVIADNIEGVFPELVNNTDPKTVNYNGLIGLLIEVVKEQQNQINYINEKLSKIY